MADLFSKIPSKIILYLDETEGKALAQLARFEVRDPRSQVYLIVRGELERRGLLQPNPALTELKKSSNKEASNG